MSTSKRKIVNHPSSDSLDRLIYEHHVYIKGVAILKKFDKLIVVLNTNHILNLNLSSFPSLKSASDKELGSWSVVGKGIGIHWKDLDEALSLKGFIRSIEPRQRRTVVSKLRRKEEMMLA